jgi:hypothetical protein
MLDVRLLARMVLLEHVHNGPARFWMGLVVEQVENVSKGAARMIISVHLSHLRS